MAADPKKLVRDWIQYLKNNKIVALQSDPSGKLQYNRKVTENDLRSFLDGEFDSKAIDAAIARVVGDGQLPATVSDRPNDASTWNNKETTPGQKQPPPEQQHRLGAPPAPPREKKYNTDDAEDIDFRTGPRKEIGNNQEPEQPRKKPRFKYQYPKDVNEDLEDNPGRTFSEAEVEAVFQFLTKPKPAQQAKAEDPALAASQAEQKKREELNKIKRTIRDTMTDQQRMSLWRALNG